MSDTRANAEHRIGCHRRKVRQDQARAVAVEVVDQEIAERFSQAASRRVGPVLPQVPGSLLVAGRAHDDWRVVRWAGRVHGAIQNEFNKAYGRFAAVVP